MVFKMKWAFIITALCLIQVGDGFLSEWYKLVLNELGYDICDDNYLSPDFNKLYQDLKSMLFGQDMIIDKVVPILESHFKLEPQKPLVICMHGWTGSGKNYATKIIVDALFKKKSDSDFVRVFNGRLHFPIDKKEYIDQYKINIQNWIKGNVTNCPRSVFIFDEIDKMPAGIIDSIKPFFDYYGKVDSVDYRKCIFIFISNIGAETINSQYMELWRQGKSRNDMEYKDFESFLRNALYNAKGGFKKSAVLEGHLVSLYLPFLPLGVEEVEKCIKAEFIRQRIEPVKEDYIAAVLDEMEFNSDRLSVSGCKRIADIIASIKFKKKYEEL